MSTTTETITDLIKSDGVLEAPLDQVEAVLAQEGKLDLWQRVRAVTTQRLGTPSTAEELADFQREWNLMFLRLLNSDGLLSIEPLEAVYGL